MEPKDTVEEIENLVNEDCSAPVYKKISEGILNTIRFEIFVKGYNRVVYYHGISDVEPDIDVVAEGGESKVLRCDNCLYPDIFRNVQILVVSKNVVHWFVVVK